MPYSISKAKGGYKVLGPLSQRLLEGIPDPDSPVPIRGASPRVSGSVITGYSDDSEGWIFVSAHTDKEGAFADLARAEGPNGWETFSHDGDDFLVRSMELRAFKRAHRENPGQMISHEGSEVWLDDTGESLTGFQLFWGSIAPTGFANGAVCF